MIVKMAKIAVIGPKEDLMDFLAMVRRLAILQIDDQPPDRIGSGEVDERLKTLRLDRETLTRRVFYEELREKITDLLTCLAGESYRETYLNPAGILDSISQVIDLHLARCRDLNQRREKLQHQLAELHRYREFMDAVSELVQGGTDSLSLDHVAIEIRDPGAMRGLERLGIKATGGCFELQTTRTASGKLVGVITTEKEFVEKIRQALQGQQVYDYNLPEDLEGLSFLEQVEKVRKLVPEYTAEDAELAGKLRSFAHHWSGIYRLMAGWLDEQLALITASASLYETEMCFVISGWLPAAELARLRSQTEAKFGGRVVIDEKEIRDEDLERVPTRLANRGYFEPFELLTRLLPVPGYGSFDLTPFIGIFFPIFFGMMLGDLGYGLLLLAPALALAKLPKSDVVRDMGKILGVAAVYTMIFGGLFGEFFGSVGREYLGLRFVLIDRHTAIIPMFYFAVAVGLVHVLLGLVLGTVASFRYHERKEAVFKMISIVIILCLALVTVAFFLPSLEVLRRPMFVVLLGAMPVVLLAGGILAPLEVLKHFGNIISYARIMAIGLTSVLLAHVANSMVGMVGSIWLGIFAAILLHGFNIILGVFAPTIHGLRLHYVEFFSKIMTDGGREFRPLAEQKQIKPPAGKEAGPDESLTARGGNTWRV